jgi:hypothetical protein
MGGGGACLKDEIKRNKQRKRGYMNINYIIDKQTMGAKDRLEVALAVVAVNAGKHIEYTKGLERFMKNLEVHYE